MDLIELIDETLGIPDHLLRDILYHIDPNEYKKLMTINDYVESLFTDDTFFNEYYQLWHTVVDMVVDRVVNTYNKKVRYLGNVKYGDEEGWYDNGKKEYIKRWKDGKQDGDEEEWYYNGKKWSIKRWKDGKQDGDEERWDINGNIIYIKRWKAGQQDGDEERWDDNGKIMYIKRWKDDQLIKNKYFL